MTYSNPIAGSGDHCHEVPAELRHVVLISNAMTGHKVSVWREADRMFCFVDHFTDVIGYACRCLLVQGASADLLNSLKPRCVPYGFDWSTRDGMMLMGVDDKNAEDLLVLLDHHHATVLWDSEG